MIRKIMLIVFILAVILAGCKKAEEQKEITTPAAPSDISIGQDVAGIDSINDDLNTGDLDNLEAELDEISW